jgi:hypothetical protein
MKAWMQEMIDRFLAEHGAVPPPWAVFNEHPYRIAWRMGAGESHLMMWWAWWEQQAFIEQQKVDYFRRWPAPHCWLAFVIEALWGVDTYAEQDHLAPYFERLVALGFGSQQDYERDLDDPKWLD